MLAKRILIGAVGFAAAVIVLLNGSFTICIALTFVTLISLYEMYKSLGYIKNQKTLSVLGFLFSLSVMLIMLSKIVNGTLSLGVFSKSLLKPLVGYVLLISISLVVKFEKVKFSLIATMFFVTMYITVFFSHILLISEEKFGEALVWFIFLGAWGTDTFAYIFGKTLGKHKLIEKVSPKKTVEGSLGGAIGCVLVFVVYGLILQNLGYNINYINLVITGIITSIISQFGDLLASCIKRENHIKDYGYILPGHGGVLDRFDSVLLVAPFIFYMGEVLPMIF